MTKDDKGVWSITVGPLAADFYSYTFNVDGVRTVDPKNPMIKQGVNSLDSMFLVPGEDAEFEMIKDVPHGEVRAAWYRSSTLNESRRMHVYTPPGYEGSDRALPGALSLHGGGDEDSGWSTIGRAGFILDNLLAAKKAVPFLIVMPNGSLPRPANMPRFTPGSPPSPEFRAAMEAVQNRFTDELLKEVVPFVESQLSREEGSREPRDCGIVDGRRANLAGVDNPSRPVCLCGHLERGSVRRAMPATGTKRTPSSWVAAEKVNGIGEAPFDLRRRPGFRPGGLQGAGGALRRSTGSSTRPTSAAAATRGSTGDTI